MIVVGYHGIGKSALAGNNNYIYLNSYDISRIDGDFVDRWYKIYSQIANRLSEQGYIVLIDYNKIVIEQLEKSNEDIGIIYPSLKLKDEWNKKLEERYRNTELTKYYIEWKNSEQLYEHDIKYLANFDRAVKFRFIRYEIGDMEYDLSSILEILRIKKQ